MNKIKTKQFHCELYSMITSICSTFILISWLQDHICVCVHMPVYVYICMCTHTCLSMYMCMCMYTHIIIYTYTLLKLFPFVGGVCCWFFFFLWNLYSGYQYLLVDLGATESMLRYDSTTNRNALLLCSFFHPTLTYMSTRN